MEVQKLADKTFQLHHSVMELVRRRDQYQLQVLLHLPQSSHANTRP